jgi:fructose-specific phosphotransferase system IIC component
LARTAEEEIRRRNWLAIAFGTIAMVFSYFPYAAAFASPEGEPRTIEADLVGVGLALAPFVFVVVAFVSRNPQAPRRVLIAMGLLLGVGLSFGLLTPVLGAAVGFAAGGAVTLNPPDVEGLIAWRLGAIGLTFVYTFVLLVVAAPAGVFAGGLLPLIMLGFADEYAVRRVEGLEEE